jgi:DNA-directed RNA polymerase specialized sigma24 family protein
LGKAILDQKAENIWNELLWQAQKGEQQAQNRLFEKLSVTLRPFLESRLRGWSREDKDDVLQETLFVIGAKLQNIKTNPHKYGVKVLRNKIGHALRNPPHKKMVSADLADDRISSALKQATERGLSHGASGDNLLDELAKKEEITRIEAALEKLPPFCRTFFLGILNGRNRKELWKLFKTSDPGLKRGTYRKRIFDCRMKLADSLET